MFFECASPETDDVVDVAHHDLILKAQQHLIHEVTEVCSCISPSVGDTFPSEESEGSDEGEVISVLGFDKHTQVSSADVERSDEIFLTQAVKVVLYQWDRVATLAGSVVELVQAARQLVSAGGFAYEDDSAGVGSLAIFDKSLIQVLLD